MSPPVKTKTRGLPATKSSLSILLPNPKPDRFAHAHPRLRPAVELEDLTRYCTALVNSRSFAELEERCPVLPDSRPYQARYEGYPEVKTLSDHVNIFRQITARFPEYHIKILHSVAYADEESGWGICYTLNEVSGEVPNVVKQGLTVNEWQRHQGLWMLVRMCGMRGMNPSGRQL